MPHQCIGCDVTYDDGSDTVLSGCTECGGTTFQFIPSSQVPDVDTTPEPQEQNWMGGGFINSDDESASEAADGPEDASQHAARTDVIDPDSLPTAPANAPDDPSPDVEETGDFEVDIETLRRELNRQFEGIKVLSPGQYEINLTRLFEREECVITLQDDGRYVISLPGEREDDPEVSLDD